MLQGMLCYSLRKLGPRRNLGASEVSWLVLDITVSCVARFFES